MSSRNWTWLILPSATLASSAKEEVISVPSLLLLCHHQNHSSTRTADNSILRLREKLEHEMAEPLHFHTVRATVYKFVG